METPLSLSQALIELKHHRVGDLGLNRIGFYRLHSQHALLPVFLSSIADEKVSITQCSTQLPSEES